MKTCLIIFAKEPEAGRVKTRLTGYIDNDKIVDLYKGFIKKTIDMANKIESDRKILAYDYFGEPEFLNSVKDEFSFFEQDGSDLGEKMHNAFLYAERSGSDATVIIGTDSPDLPFEYINDAFLRLSEKDVVIGPAIDGGYYLIGVRKPDPDIFKDVEWSSNKVLGRTLKNIKNAGKVVSLLDEWYDIDTPEDLERYLEGTGMSD